jgi:5-dehydro-2-deoxygluconokinase
VGLNAPQGKLVAAFREARGSATCRGFAIGRTIFFEPSRAWLANEIDDATLVERVRTSFERLIAAWRDARGEKVHGKVRERAA